MSDHHTSVKNKFRFDWKHLTSELQGALAAILFALSLFYFVERLMGNQNPEPLEHLVTTVVFVLAFGLLIRFWKFTVPTILLLAVVVLGSSYFEWDLGIPLFSADYWTEIGEFLHRGIRWAITWNVEKGPMPTHYYSALVLLSTLVSTIVVWRLPMGALALGLLIVPMFFLEDLTENGSWFLWFLIGLYSVFVAMSKSWLPLRSNRLSFLVGLGVVMATLLLGTVIPKDAIFIPKFHQWLDSFNDNDESGIQGFTLGDVGFRPEGSRIGGPVQLTNTPFFEYSSSMESATYLRGASFDSFEEGIWGNQYRRPLYPFINRANFAETFGEMQSDIFWFGNQEAASRAFQTNLQLFHLNLFSVSPLYDLPVVFHAGKTGIVEISKYDFTTSPENIASIIKHNQPDVKFDYTGALYASSSYRDTGYYALDSVQSGDLVGMQSTLRSLELTPERSSDGERKYEHIVREHDPALAQIVYGDQHADVYEKLRAMKSHFEDNYTYNLDVPFIPYDTEFLEWFLTQEEGYCVYFATAWTLLLQDIGYTARYAEGFVVPTGNIAISSSDRIETEAGQSATPVSTPRLVTTDRAHAWMELYFPETGWMYVETTNASHIRALMDPNATQEQIAHQPPPGPSDPNYVPPDVSEPIPELSSEELSSESSAPLEIPVDGPEDEEPGIIGSVFSFIKMILPWLLAISLVSAFVWWRWNGYKQIHNTTYLLHKYKGEYGVLTTKIWYDIQSLAKAYPISIAHTDTPKQVFEKLYTTLEIPVDQARSSYESVAQTIYGERVIEEAPLVDLMAMHERVERRVKKKLNSVEWFLKRVILRKPF